MHVDQNTLNHSRAVAMARGNTVELAAWRERLDKWRDQLGDLRFVDPTRPLAERRIHRNRHYWAGVLDNALDTAMRDIESQIEEEIRDAAETFKVRFDENDDPDPNAYDPDCVGTLVEFLEWHANQRDAA